MNNLIEYLKKNKLFILGAVILIGGIITSLFLLIIKDQGGKDKIVDRLTQSEQKYPEAPAQPFLTESQEQGILVVSSQIKDIRIMVDSPEEEVSISSKEIPVNINPFKISSIPIGKHNLFAFKEGYEIFETDFIIEKDKVTRLSVNLIPLSSAQNNDPKVWISKLPVQDQYYYADYDSVKQRIVVTLNPPPAVETTKDIQIEFLKKVVLNDLKNLGINISQVEWVVK